MPLLLLLAVGVSTTEKGEADGCRTDVPSTGTVDKVRRGSFLSAAMRFVIMLERPLVYETLAPMVFVPLVRRRSLAIGSDEGGMREEGALLFGREGMMRGREGGYSDPASIKAVRLVIFPMVIVCLCSLPV